MAKKKTPAPAPQRPNVEYLDRAPSDVHNGLSEYVEETTGHAVSPGDVALVLRLYPVYLKSDEVKKARDAAEAERQREKAERAEAKRAKAKARLEKIEAERARLLADLGVEDHSNVVSLKVAPEPEGEKSIEAPDEPTEDDAAVAETGDDAEEVVEGEIVVEGEAESDDDEVWDTGDEEDEDEF